MFSVDSFNRPVFRKLFRQLSFFITFLNKPVLDDLKVKSEIYLNLLVLYKQETECLNLSSDTCSQSSVMFYKSLKEGKQSEIQSHFTHMCHGL